MIFQSKVNLKNGGMMQEKIAAYFKGLAFSFIAVVVFSAFGWIQIGTEFNKYLALLMVAASFWTFVYFTGKIIWSLISVFSAFTLGVGFFVGLFFVAYILIKVTVYLLPSGIATFTNDELRLFVIGTFYSFLYFTSSKNEDMKDEEEDEGYDGELKNR